MCRSSLPLWRSVVLPFALDFAGLPLRSSIDVVVFAIACMGLNILVGHTGLVSFGHGAWFGLGAYAAALSQRYWFPGAIILPDAVRNRFSWPSSATLVRRAHSAPARRLFLAAHAGADRAPVCHRLPLDRAHRRRERTWRRDARDRARRRSRARSRHIIGLVAAIGMAVCYLALALSPFAGRQRAGGDPRERAARTLHRLSNQPLQADRLRAVGDRGGDRRYAVGLQSPLRLGRAAGQSPSRASSSPWW